MFNFFIIKQKGLFSPGLDFGYPSVQDPATLFAHEARAGFISYSGVKCGESVDQDNLDLDISDLPLRRSTGEMELHDRFDVDIKTS